MIALNDSNDYILSSGDRKTTIKRWTLVGQCIRNKSGYPGLVFMGGD